MLGKKRESITNQSIDNPKEISFDKVGKEELDDLFKPKEISFDKLGKKEFDNLLK